MNPENVTIFGAGTWGITLACLLWDKGHSVKVWEYEPSVVDAIRATRRPLKLPDLVVPDEMPVTNDLNEATNGSRHWIFVVPSRGVRPLAKNLKKAFKDAPPATVVLCAKGIESDSGYTMSQIAESVFTCRGPIAALSGPSHAEEVSKGMPTTIVAAARDEGVALQVQDLFNTERFRVYTSDDLLGIELGGALKNVIAIASGICDGLGFGDNSRAALITRGLAEITRLGVQIGARMETFAGLAGMGDLIVTATSHHSRNRNFGELLGRGVDADAARAQIGMEVEGIWAARSAQRLAERFKVDMPISRQVYEILYNSKPPASAVRDLLSRDPKPEIY